MILPLILFVASTYFLAQFLSIGPDAAFFIPLTILQYSLYGYFLYRIFSVKKFSILLMTIASLTSFCIYLSFPPKVSNDVYRYLWDGLLQKEGLDPYQYVPSDWRLHDIQEANMPLYAEVDWRDKFTPYPPVAQSIFVKAHDLYQVFGLPGGKFLFALPFVLCAIFLYFLTTTKIYAAFILNPLVLLELAANAHLDGWVLLFMIIGLYLYKKQKYIFASILWTLAIATKIYPIIFVPFFVIDLIRKRKFVLVFVTSALSLTILYLLYMPFIKDTLFPITRYVTLPDEQEFNASIYRYLYQIMGIEKPWTRALASKLCGVFFAISIALLLFVKKYSYAFFLLVGIIYLLFSPLVFAWYTLFTFAFVVWHMKETNEYKLIYFYAFMQCIVTLMYFEPGIWIVRDIMLNIEYVLLLLCMLWYLKVYKVFRKT